MKPSISPSQKGFEAYFSSKLITPNDLEEHANALRAEGTTIATLNGSFDLLHAGHLHMIYEGSCQADCLLMLLNSDASIQQYKSPDRPIIPLEYRLRMVAALGFVTYVSWFDQTTPLEVLRKVRPTVHVNGREYGEDCIERDVVVEGGGRIHIVDLIPGLSTTTIIDKISALCALSSS